MNRLRWWLVSGAGIPWALRIGARVSSTHPTGQRACRRPANFIVAGQAIQVKRPALAASGQLVSACGNLLPKGTGKTASK